MTESHELDQAGIPYLVDCLDEYLFLGALIDWSSDHGARRGFQIQLTKEKNIMKLSSPKVITWWIAVILGALGILASLGTIPALAGVAFWLVVAGLVLLVLGTLLKGL